MSRIEENPFLQIIENGLPNSVAKWHHYLPLYHRHFRKYQENASSNNKVIILEIGVCLGGSLDMWNKYFGKENCEIYGIDIDDTCKRFDTSNNGGNIHILIGDQEDIELLELDKTGIHVAQYITELPAKEVFQNRLKQAITLAKENYAKRLLINSNE